MTKFTKNISKTFLDLLEIVFISASIIVLTFLFLAQPLVVTGDSMQPIFTDKEQLIIEKISIKYKEFGRGEIIVIKHPDDPKLFVIKRVIGLPNETFMILNGSIYIDGKLLNELYLSEDTQTNEKSYILEGELLIIPENAYVLLGDNRSNSSDSRTWGPIDMDSIVGRGLLVYYPLENIRLVQ